MELFKIVTLSFSALLLCFVGAMRLSNPVKTYLDNSGIKLDNDVDLLNEVRGLSAVMLCGGIIAVLGIFFPSITLTSYVVVSLIFLGFGLGRFISIAKDGKPHKKIIQGIAFELVLGFANLYGTLSMLS